MLGDFQLSIVNFQFFLWVAGCGYACDALLSAYSARVPASLWLPRILRRHGGAPFAIFRLRLWLSRLSLPAIPRPGRRCPPTRERFSRRSLSLLLKPPTTPLRRLYGSRCSPEPRWTSAECGAAERISRRPAWAGTRNRYLRKIFRAPVL